MKFLIPLLAFGLAATHAKDESTNYLNFIIQKQNDENGTEHLLTGIKPTGSSTAPKGVTGSSVFSLWTVHRTKGTEHFLDEKTVSSYHPQATITITTKDPYKRIPRTRVDQPFTVTHNVDGLVTNDPNVQAAAKSVILQHKVISYHPDKYFKDASADVSKTVGVIDKNGTTSDTHITLVKAPDLTQARGREVFTIYARPDFGANASMLARAKVQIWPIAKATVTGIDTNTNYIRLPDIHVKLNDLYPDSTTYVRLYEGAPKANPKNPHIINTSYVIIDDSTPQNRTFSINGLETGITQEGRYTVEVIHITPFGTDLLSQTYPLRKKSRIRVVGSLNSSE